MTKVTMTRKTSRDVLTNHDKARGGGTMKGLLLTPVADKQILLSDKSKDETHGYKRGGKKGERVLVRAWQQISQVTTTTMPELTLIYFNARGRAELSRWIMAYGSIPFTDDRIERENWPARKPNVFSNRVPVLMVDGKPLSESMAIARYLAGLADLVPKDPFDAAKVDSICDKLNDVMSEVHKILVMTPDEKEMKEKYDKYHADILKPFFTCFNKNLEGKDWYIPGKITWADLFVGLSMTYVQMKVPGILDDFPNITTRVDKVMAIPKIKEWNDKQPKDMPF